MTILYDKLILFCCCFLLLIYNEPQIESQHVICILITIIFTSVSTYINIEFVPFKQLKKEDQLGQFLNLLLFGFLIFIYPKIGIFFPFLFYEFVISMHSKLYFLTFLLPFISFRSEAGWYPILICVISFLAYIMAQKTRNLDQLEKEYKLLRDTSVERNLLLKQKNKNLLEKQDYEIHVATLKERNRIAREIHDNVGHLLSRSILQAGALTAINTQESQKEPLLQLKDTLSSAMDSIRKSVHDLHDESIDLHSSVIALFSDFSEYTITLDYDVEHILPQNVKYCFISIVKESLSNISRHSNATCITITLREHPNLYQLIIADNGSCIQMKQSGIGLQNMKERVDNLNGQFSITTNRGFRIFVSIPIQRQSYT